MLIGVVGKANTGKSTFFKAATLAEAEIANYPFATIKPNSGIAYVKIKCPEREFNVKCQPREGFCLNNIRFVPIPLLDVAGLIPGAHEGKGMGNKFLDDLRQADAFIHVIDVAGTTNEKGEPQQPLSYDPANDIKFLEVELDMWYLGIFKKVWEKFSKQVNQEKSEIDKAIAKQFSGLNVTEQLVGSVMKSLGLNENDIIKWTEDDLKNFVRELRKKTKPMIIACNKIDIKGAYENYLRLKEEFKEYTLIPCSSESELALREATRHNLIKYTPGYNDFEVIDKAKLNDKQEHALNFIKENILKEYNGTGVQQVLDYVVFNMLSLIAVFPVSNNKLSDQKGNILPDCFLVPNGITALEFAYKVHTDLGKNFIRAVDIKTKQIIGKEHKLKHLDIIEIVSGK